ncbi:unnamed protein product [Cylicocyclus nassatus]|uniref:Uncharacterized protein n=1 Tax=Cylicocyclus nassatus TaxID=53992 RepID=A0AA36GY32_CYLNA|nr:unnamed protein product [Cylicocyclus nassatus]
MDLIDLYHAYDHQVAFNDGDLLKPVENGVIDVPKESQKMKKPRFVPWEPYKAAPSADRFVSVGMCLTRIPTSMLSEDCQSEQILALKKELGEVKSQLELERKLNAELKRLMVATISDELQGQVQALTEDKIRLAHRVQEFSEKLTREDEEVDHLKIDRDVWKSKFLAQSIRTDELTYRAEVLIGMLREAQRIVRSVSNSTTNTDAKRFASLDLKTLISRSPCEERLQRNGPNYENVTIACCPNCSGREILLL